MRTSGSFEARHATGGIGTSAVTHGAPQLHLLSPGGIRVSPAAAAASAAAAAVAAGPHLRTGSPLAAAGPPSTSYGTTSGPTSVVGRSARSSQYPAVGHGDGARHTVSSTSSSVGGKPSQVLAASIPKPLATSPTYRSACGSSPIHTASNSPKAYRRNLEQHDAYQVQHRHADTLMDDLDVAPAAPPQQPSGGLTASTRDLAAAIARERAALARDVAACLAQQDRRAITPMREATFTLPERPSVEDQRRTAREHVSSRLRGDREPLASTARDALAASTRGNHGAAWEVPPADSVELRPRASAHAAAEDGHQQEHAVRAQQHQHGQSHAKPHGSRPYGAPSSAAAAAAARGRHASNMAEIRMEDVRSTPSTRCKTPPRTPSTRSCRESDPEPSRVRPRVRSIDSGLRGARGGASNTSPFTGPLERSSSACRSTVPALKQDAVSAVLEEDCAEYVDRFLPGYERGRLLGRGACAVVWLATPSGQSNQVAVKQIAKGTSGKKRSDMESARKEIFFGSFFFHTGGEPKLPPSQYPGICSIAKLLDHHETKRDIWLVMEYGGISLTKCAYEIRGEFLRGERLYRVTHLPFLQSMKRDDDVLRLVLRQLLSALSVLAEHHVVHSDIKPDNILVDEDPQTRLPRCRFIDLGSAFSFDCPEGLALATPEYMPPEALESFGGRPGGSGGGLAGRLSMGRTGAIGACSNGGARKSTDGSKQMFKRSQPWSFDIWSLGSILLELSLGTPLWLSYKCRVADDQRVCGASMGLFAVPGRDPEKILTKQSEALRHRGLHAILKGSAGVPLHSNGGVDLLCEMLAWDPMERISPQDALEHPWMLGETAP